MKLELTRGCIAGWLGADGIAEHEMDEQMREKVFEKIFDFLKKFAREFSLASVGR